LQSSAETGTSAQWDRRFRLPARAADSGWPTDAEDFLRKSANIASLSEAPAHKYN